MEHAAPAIFTALEESDFAAAIRQSPILYPAANVGHILALVIFASAVAVMDVRLLGGFAAMEPRALLARVRWVAIAAFAAMALTGSMLFAADASHLATNGALQMKFTLMAAAFANIVLYEVWGRPAIETLAPGMPTPVRARASGAASLALWLTVAACGRSIAYF